DRYFRALRRFPDSGRAQDRRPEGRRGAGGHQRRADAVADRRRRRPGTRPPGRHGERRRDRRFWRGGARGAGESRPRRPAQGPAPLAAGGGQERGTRAGTENYAAIAGFGAAAREALVNLGRADRLRARRDAIENLIRDVVPDATIFAGDVERLPNTVFFAIPDV